MLFLFYNGSFNTSSNLKSPKVLVYSMLGIRRFKYETVLASASSAPAADFTLRHQWIPEEPESTL